MTNRSGVDDQALVDWHIRSAVAAAKRKGVTLRFSQFAQRLHGRNRAVSIDDDHILTELTRRAAELGVAVRVDQLP